MDQNFARFGAGAGAGAREKIEQKCLVINKATVSRRWVAGSLAYQSTVSELCHMLGSITEGDHDWTPGHHLPGTSREDTCAGHHLQHTSLAR